MKPNRHTPNYWDGGQWCSEDLMEIIENEHRRLNKQENK